MLCWYNGEYRDADLSHIGGLENILKRQKETYVNYPGLIVGDFKIQSVDYDWGKRCQRVETECTRCGSEDIKFLNFAAWKRGRGESRQCSCRKIKPQKEPKTKPVFDPATLVGEDMFGWVVEDVKNNQLVVKCKECGKTKLSSVSQFKSGKIYSCNHKIVTDYSDPKWIGQKNGHLTAIKYNGKYFDCKCDCGNVVSVKSTYLFTYKTATSCGKSDCQFTEEDAVRGRECQVRGLDYEQRVADLFEQNGYHVEKTRCSGDFGVDLIVVSKNDRVAIQCKRMNKPSTIRSIQEVYAGGRYYDCNKFAVISPSGFTDNALLMSGKLGVYCATHQFNFEDLDNARESCIELLETKSKIDCWKDRRAKVYTVGGEELTSKEISAKYDIPIGTIHSKLSRGVGMEDIVAQGTSGKKKYTIDGFTGSITEIANKYGIRAQTIEYRMKHRGMSLEEAVKTPPQAQGRPKTRS